LLKLEDRTFGYASHRLEGQDWASSVFSPMANSAALAARAFMKAVVNAKPWLKVPLAVRKKWAE
jgi:amidase